jgi:hypothetical protein
MRVRDHIAISTAAAAMSGRWLGRNALALWAGAVLIDADHYLAFCLQERRVNPAAAVRFYGRAVVPEHRATRALHAPACVLGVLCLGARLRPLVAVGVGMGLHVMLDAGHEARMNRARADALDRDQNTCQACGTDTAQVVTHLARQPWLLPSYRPQNVVSLCDPCHARAHAA